MTFKFDIIKNELGMVVQFYIKPEEKNLTKEEIVSGIKKGIDEFLTKIEGKFTMAKSWPDSEKTKDGSIILKYYAIPNENKINSYIN